MNLICTVTDNDIGEQYQELTNPKERFASRGIVLRDDGKIAIFYKSKKNEYKLPGGGREDNELPEETFKREVLEETGCKVEIIKQLGITEEYKSKINFKQTSNVFVGKVIEDTNQLHVTQEEKEEGAVLFWETPEKALELIKGCYNKLIKSEYQSVYSTKFIIVRDQRILEYYINNR